MPDGERLRGRVEPGDTVVAAIGPADLDTMRALFSPEFFIRRYSSIIAGARPGEKEDPFLYYLENVRDLVLDPCVEFYERFYLMTNLDVNAAVKAGTFHCGFHHWVMHGCEEGRPGYDAATDGDDAQDLVLSTDSRLRALFEAEHYASRYFPGERLSEEEAFGRFLGGGMEQGQIPVPSTVFDENFYLCYYDDIREGKARGEIPSGFYHYAIAGSKEGRLPVYDMNRLLAAKLGELASPVLLSRTDSIEAKLAPLKTAIDPDRPRVINLFVPSLDPDLMFGGYIAFLHFASRLQERGYPIRFVITEDGYCSRDWFLKGLTGRPRWLESFRQQEIINVASRREPVPFNTGDVCVGYSTWTAHAAWSVARHLNCKRIAFFIQEYEPIFHQHDAFGFITHSAYSIPHLALFNSTFLADYFRENRIGVFGPDGDGAHLVFRHALADVKPDRQGMLQRQRSGRRLLCYARPELHASRNLFEVCVIALRRAVREGVFGPEWSFHGIGSLGKDYEIAIDRTRKMRIVSRVPQAEYEARLASFDVGLSLMWAPHPSIAPFEFARAGIVTVTNEFGIRTKQRLSAFGHNIVPAKPSVEGIVEALRMAAWRSENADARIAGSRFDWPTDWDRVFDMSFMDRFSEELGTFDWVSGGGSALSLSA